MLEHALWPHWVPLQVPKRENFKSLNFFGEKIIKSKPSMHATSSKKRYPESSYNLFFYLRSYRPPTNLIIKVYSGNITVFTSFLKKIVNGKYFWALHVYTLAGKSNISMLTNKFIQKTFIAHVDNSITNSDQKRFWNLVSIY